jgi:preprotein translocase subunit SecA
MDTLRLEDDIPIENKLLTGQIEAAQKRVESRNFGIRKNVLDFDDVMNRQREIIYGQRGKVLDGDDLSANIRKMIDEVVASAIDVYVADTEDHDDWNLDGLRDHFLGWIADDRDFRFTREQLHEEDREHIKNELTEKAQGIYTAREKEFTPEVIREAERVILLRNVDAKWMNHIDAMDELKRGIYLRSYGQKDPVIEYRIEGFEMFDEMIASIREDTIKALYLFRLRKPEEDLKRTQVAKPLAATHGESDGSIKKQPVRKAEKVGRNDPCPCGSGKKYKKCCGQ